MSIITGDDEDEVAREANAAIEAAKRQCLDRGELQPMHVYVDNSGECVCKRGPKLNERKTR